MHDTKLSPIPSSGNKFAPQSESSRKASLKSGKGWLIFTFTYMLTLAVFVMVLMYPQLVPFFYAATILPFFLFRFVSYYILARHHFCLEVCYFINYAVLAYILVFFSLGSLGAVPVRLLGYPNLHKRLHARHAGRYNFLHSVPD
jgi:hypothetical protein